LPSLAQPNNEGHQNKRPSPAPSQKSDDSLSLSDYERNGIEQIKKVQVQNGRQSMTGSRRTSRDSLFNSEPDPIFEEISIQPLPQYRSDFDFTIPASSTSDVDESTPPKHDEEYQFSSSASSRPFKKFPVPTVTKESKSTGYIKPSSLKRKAESNDESDDQDKRERSRKSSKKSGLDSFVAGFDMSNCFSQMMEVEKFRFEQREKERAREREERDRERVRERDRLEDERKRVREAHREEKMRDFELKREMQREKREYEIKMRQLELEIIKAKAQSKSD
jgi:hypothetical protein